MKKRGIIAVIAVAVSAALFMGFSTVSAASFRSGERAAVSKDETVNDTLFVAGSIVNVAGTVNGDVFCAGQSVTISGTVNGDVICAAQNIRVGGTVNGDVRLAGNFVEVNGTVDSNATIAAETFILAESGTVAGDLSAGSATSEIAGKVGRDAILGASQATVSGQIGRNIQSEVEELQLLSTARVSGSVDYKSEKEAIVENGATVQNGLTRQEPPREDKRGSAVAATIGLGYTFVSLFIVSMLLALLAPRLLQTVTSEGKRYPGRSVIAGLLTVFVVPIAVIFLFVTLVGAPLGVLIALLWFVALFLGGPILSYFVGRMVMQNSKNPLIYMLVGSSLVLVLSAVPVLNVLIGLTAVIFGTGMVVSRAMSALGKPSYQIAANDNKKWFKK